MKEGLLGGTLGVSSRSEPEEARVHVARWIGSESTQGRRLPARRGGRDRRRVRPRRRMPTGCAASRPGRRCGARAVRGVIESMNGARFVHDHARGARLGGADRRRDRRSRGWRRWPARPTRSTRACWPSCRRAIWCRRSGCPTRAIRRERELARFRLHLVRHRTTLKNRIHADADRLRASVPGLGSVRSRRPRAARPPGDPRSVAAQHRRQPAS